MEERIPYLESAGIAIELTKQESIDFGLVLDATSEEQLLVAFEIARPAFKKMYCDKTYMRSARLLSLAVILANKHGQKPKEEVMQRIDEMCGDVEEVSFETFRKEL